MKVKIITRDNYDSFENSLNNFIEDKKVINISISEDSKQVTITALILYEEEE